MELKLHTRDENGPAKLQIYTRGGCFYDVWGHRSNTLAEIVKEGYEFEQCIRDMQSVFVRVALECLTSATEVG